MTGPAYDAGTVHAAAQLDLRPYMQSLGHMEGATQRSSSVAARHFRVVEGATDSARASATQLAGSYLALAGVLGAVGVAGIGASIGALKLAGNLEQTGVAFEVMLGSASAAKAMLDNLQGFAASTPFQLPEIQQSARSLLAFGEAAGQIPTVLRRIGDVAAGTGQPLTELATIYGKARVQGRLFMEDINQLTGRGVPIIQELAKQFGVTEGAVRGLVESGAVNFSHLEAAFAALTAQGSRFGGLMDRMSATTLGRWSTLLDEATQVAIEFSTTMLPAANAVIDAAGGVTAALSSLTDGQKAAIGQGVVLGSGLMAMGAGITALRPVIDAASEALTGMGTVAGDSMRAVQDAVRAANARRVAVPVATTAQGAVVDAMSGVIDATREHAPVRAALQEAEALEVSRAAQLAGVQARRAAQAAVVEQTIASNRNAAAMLVEIGAGEGAMRAQYAQAAARVQVERATLAQIVAEEASAASAHAAAQADAVLTRELDAVAGAAVRAQRALLGEAEAAAAAGAASRGAAGSAAVAASASGAASTGLLASLGAGFRQIGTHIAGAMTRVAAFGSGAMAAMASPIGLAVAAVVASLGGLFAVLTSKGEALKPLRDAATWAFDGFRDAIGGVLEALQPFGEILLEVVKVVGVVLGGAMIGLLDVLAAVARVLASVLVPALQITLLSIKLLVGAVGALGLSIADVMTGHFTRAAGRWRSFWRDAVDDSKGAWREIAESEARIWGVNRPAASGAPAGARAGSTAPPAGAGVGKAAYTFGAVDVDSLQALEEEALRLQARVRELNAQRINLVADSDEAKALGEELGATERHLGLITGRIDVLREGLTRSAAAASAMTRALAQGAAEIAGQGLQVGLARLRQSLALGDSERTAAALATRRQEAQLANVRAIAAAEAQRDRLVLAAARAVDLTDAQRGDKLRAINAAHELAVVQIGRQHDQATALIEADEIRLQHAQRLREITRESTRATVESGLALVRTLGDLTRGGRKSALSKELLAGKEGISAFERQRQETAIASEDAINAYQAARAKQRQALELAHLEAMAALKRNQATTPEGLKAAELAHAEGMLRYDEATADALAEQEAARERSLALLDRQERAARAQVDAEQAVADLATKRARNAAGLATGLGRLASDWWAEMLGGSAKAIADAQNGLADLQARNLQAVQDAVTAARRQIKQAQESGELTLSPEQLAQLERVLGRPFRGAEDLAALEEILQAGPAGLKPVVARILEAFEDARHQIQLEEIKVKLQIDKASFEAAKRSTMEIFNSALFNPVFAKGAAMKMDRMIMPTLPALNYALPGGMGPIAGPYPMPAPVQAQRQDPIRIILQPKDGFVDAIVQRASDHVAITIERELR